jgi:hypothetical protein
MQTKNLIVWNYNSNIFTKNIGNFDSIKKAKLLIKLLLLLLLIFSFTVVTHFYNSLNNVNYKNLLIANFKSDISMLGETASIIESERQSGKNAQINNFGSDGIPMKVDEIKPDLKSFLINIADKNNDGKLSNDEISKLKIMKLEPDIFHKRLSELQFNLNSADFNLKNYIIITCGEYSGTILYNGPIKFIDSENKRYFGLELYSLKK